MITDFIVGAIYVAIIYSMVRPHSPAAGAVKNISDALIGVVGSATGYNQIGAFSG
jgi:xanthosine utilization system XapX-like protein